MPHLNVEIKASCFDPSAIRTILHAKNARFVGLDHQTDTYFLVPNGRLKLREGNIENNLIHYFRDSQAGPKKSEVSLYSTNPDPALKETLSRALGIKVVVDKQREIYFIENVKFHLDTVEGLGSFVEIEAIDTDGSLGEAKLEEQCSYYLNLFGILQEALISDSYSDMLGRMYPPDQPHIA